MESASGPDCTGARGWLRIFALEEWGITVSEPYAEAFGAIAGNYRGAGEFGCKFESVCESGELAASERRSTYDDSEFQSDHSSGDECPCDGQRKPSGAEWLRCCEFKLVEFRGRQYAIEWRARRDSSYAVRIRSQSKRRCNRAEGWFERQCVSESRFPDTDERREKFRRFEFGVVRQRSRGR